MTCVRDAGSSKLGPLGEMNFGHAYWNRSSNTFMLSSLIISCKVLVGIFSNVVKQCMFYTPFASWIVDHHTFHGDGCGCSHPNEWGKEQCT
jgi:hypothetical protein